MASSNETRLLAALGPAVTGLGPAHYAERDYSILAADGPELRELGIAATGPGELTVVVTDPERPVGHLAIDVRGRDTLLFLDNAEGLALAADIRVLGDDTTLFVNGPAPGTQPDRIGLRTVLLRSHRQFLFWGRGATAVELSVELEGEGEGLVVGDDALIAGEVWIRNHDMHAMHELATGRLLSRPPVTTVLERHVWLGQGALLLGCTRIGAGSIVGARSLVKGELPAHVAAAGTPARVRREGVSWGRSSAGMTEAERAGLGQAPAPRASQPVAAD